MLNLPVTAFDKIVIHGINNVINGFQTTNLFQAFHSNFGINNFNFAIPIILIIGAYGISKWLEAKLKQNCKFSNAVTTTVNDKIIYITIGVIVVIAIIML